MDNKRVDALNQSRNIRLLALKEIFEEDTERYEDKLYRT